MNEPAQIKTIGLTNIKKIEKLNPQPGEAVIIWTKELKDSQADAVNEWIKSIKEHYPFTIFIVLPSDSIIEGMETHNIKSLMKEIDGLKDKLESALLSKS